MSEISDDFLVVKFKCGHTAVNPEKKHKRFVCPICNKKVSIVQSIRQCATNGCHNKVVSNGYPAKYCEKCRKERIKKSITKASIKSGKTRREKAKLLYLSTHPDCVTPNMTYQEIAEVIGTSHQNIQQIVQNALIKFHDFWLESHQDWETDF